MTDTVVDALIVDLLIWLESGERTYDEAIDVWRTSCPKLKVWEDAKDRGLVATEIFNRREIVRITPAGFAFLCEQRKSPKSTERPEVPVPPDFPH